MLSVCKIWYWLSSLLLMVQNDVLRIDPANWKRSEFQYLLCQSKRFKKQGFCLSPQKLLLMSPLDAGLSQLLHWSCSGPWCSLSCAYSIQFRCCCINIWAVAQAEDFQKILLECRKASSSLCMAVPRARSVPRADPHEGHGCGAGLELHRDLLWALQVPAPFPHIHPA